MKKYFIVLCTALWFLTGCGTKTVEQKEIENPPIEQNKSDTQEGTTFPATYTIPDGLVKSDTYSTDAKIFYIEEGKDDTASPLPDNISINIGKNRYSIKQHTMFRDAIFSQLLQQVNQIKAT